MAGERTADVVICGAGIAGVSAAYVLAVDHGLKNVVIVDDRPPLTLTSDKSTEAYRNWWPGPGDTMVSFMNRSIDRLEALAGESDNFFHLNRRGYVYLTANPDHARQIESASREISHLGAGPLRIHTGTVSADYQLSPAHDYRRQPVGADLLANPELIQQYFPYIAPDAVSLVHARRCGWLSAQQLGMYLLDQARRHGVQLLSGRVCGIEHDGGMVTGVHVAENGSTHTIATARFVNAAGPLLREVGQLLDLSLPVFNELHGKIAFEDPLGVIPRDAPLMIWDDPLHLPWDEAEREELAAFEDTAWLLDEFPAGLHFRPEGGPGSQTILALWPYHIDTFERPTWPLQFEPEFVEVIFRGLARMVPGMAVYQDRLSKPWIDGGYYCKTRENRPLIGPLPVDGAFIFGALSGYGIMAAMAGAELLAAHVVGDDLPAYAPAFVLARYEDPDYLELLATVDATHGQL